MTPLSLKLTRKNEYDRLCKIPWKFLSDIVQSLLNDSNIRFQCRMIIPPVPLIQNASFSNRSTAQSSPNTFPIQFSFLSQMQSNPKRLHHRYLILTEITKATKVLSNSVPHYSLLIYSRYFHLSISISTSFLFVNFKHPYFPTIDKEIMKLIKKN